MTTPQRAEKTFYALSTDLLRVFHSQLERELGRSATPDDTRPLRALLGQARWSRHDHEKTRLATDLITGLLARETPLDVGQLQADLQRLELIDATWSRLSPSDEQAR